MVPGFPTEEVIAAGVLEEPEKNIHPRDVSLNVWMNLVSNGGGATFSFYSSYRKVPKISFNGDSLKYVSFLFWHCFYTEAVKDLGEGQPDVHTFDVAPVHQV